MGSRPLSSSLKTAPKNGAMRGNRTKKTIVAWCFDFPLLAYGFSCLHLFMTSHLFFLTLIFSLWSEIWNGFSNQFRSGHRRNRAGMAGVPTCWSKCRTMVLTLRQEEERWFYLLRGTCYCCAPISKTFFTSNKILQKKRGKKTWKGLHH